MVFGRVYCIRSHQTDDIYIGSTTQTLSQRMTDHKRYYNNGHTNYITSLEIIQYEDAYIELLFEGEFESKNALHKKEGEYIREMRCVNRQIPGRTMQEWYEDNKERMLLKNHQNYVDNKEKILEQNKIYRQIHKKQIQKRRQKIYKCECGSEILFDHKARHEQTKKHQKFILSESVVKNFDEVHSFSGQSEESSEVLM
jgi:hypothetical protein